MRKYLKKGLREFTKRYPELPPVFVPRWHDYQREEAQKLYQSASETVLIPAMIAKLPVYYKAGEQGQEIIPCIYSDDSGKGSPVSGIINSIRKSRWKVEQLMSRGVLQKQEDWDTLISVDGDRLCQKMLDMLSSLSKKGCEFVARRSGYQFLHVLPEHSPDVAATDFQPAYFGPEFVAQFFHASYTKPHGTRSFSSMSPLPVPHQRVETPRSERTITISMLSRAILNEQDFTAVFSNGNITELQQDDRSCAFAGGIGSKMEIQKAQHIKQHSFGIENAFAIEGDTLRGLRQTLKLSAPATQIDGRITNDFIVIEDHRELYLDSYIQHPWIREGYSLNHYIPQMLVLWDGISSDTVLTLSSWNSDRTGRTMLIDLSVISDRRYGFSARFCLDTGLWSCPHRHGPCVW